MRLEAAEVAKPGLVELRLRARPIYSVMSLARREWLCENGIHTGICDVKDLAMHSLVADKRFDVVCCVCGGAWDANGERVY